MAEEKLAAAVAVVGPANAGKTTLLHQIDEKLQARLDSVLVIKGSPDGTGRYLYHAPQLRNDPEFKLAAKGAWGVATVERICEWIACGRRNLALALVDFGGLHNERTAAGNLRMLGGCTHYLLVTRDGDEAGRTLWEGVCREAGLERVGWLRSLAAGGAEPAVLAGDEGWEATFQVDVRPGAGTNDAVMEALAGRLAGLSRPTEQIAYVNLHQAEDWSPEQIGDVAGRERAIRALAGRTGVVVLGGRAPIWAYLAGLRVAVEENPEARVFFFDPQQPEQLVEIPAGRAGTGERFPEGVLRTRWEMRDGLAALVFELGGADKMLPPVAAQNLVEAPDPGPAPADEVGLFGRAPTWLHGTYARWLARAGARRIAYWDARLTRFLTVWEQAGGAARA
jgi:hypothetical protein